MLVATVRGCVGGGGGGGGGEKVRDSLVPPVC